MAEPMGYRAGRFVADFLNPVGNPLPAPSYSGQTDMQPVLDFTHEFVHPLDNPLSAPSYTGQFGYIDRNPAGNFIRGMMGETVPPETPPAWAQPQSAPQFPGEQRSPYYPVGAEPTQPVNQPPTPYPMSESQAAPYRPVESPAPVGGVADHPESPAPQWSQGPKSYAEQVADKMNQPFLPEYNVLRYGKPLEFDGADQAQVTSGKNWTNIKDRPLTLAEIDPTMVKEKDWGKYLEASVKAMSTATFDAAKDPGVIQQMQALNNSYFRVKAAEKQRQAVEKQKLAVEDNARLVDAMAGMRDEETDRALERKQAESTKQAKQLRKQAASIQEYLDKNGYSGDEKVNADKAREKLIQQAQALEDETGTRDEAESKAAENSLWYQGEAGKIRQQHAKLDEDAAMTALERDQAAQSTRLSYMQAMNVGQSQEEANVRQEAERTWTEGQRAEETAADQLRGATAEERVKNRAEAQARSRGMEAVRSTRARADDKDQEYKALEKELEDYDVGTDPKTKKIVVMSKSGTLVPEAEYAEKKARLARLAKTRDAYRTRADEVHRQLDPMYAALTDIPEEPQPDTTPAPEPGQFRRRSSPAATFQLGR